jgi:hypothetical protein
MHTIDAFWLFFGLMIGTALGLAWKKAELDAEIKLRKQWQDLAKKIIDEALRKQGTSIKEFYNDFPRIKSFAKKNPPIL